MKRILCLSALVGLIALGFYYPIVWWIIVIAIVVIIALIYFVLNSYDKTHEDFMKRKFGENYKQLMTDGKLGLRIACSCKPDSRFTSVADIQKKSNINLPPFVVSECKETLEDFTGDYSGEATIEFSVPIDDDIITQIEDGMQKDGSLWRKGENGEYVCDLLKPYVGEPVTDEYWTLLIQENKREGIIRYGRV